MEDSRASLLAGKQVGDSQTYNSEHLRTALATQFTASTVNEFIRHMYRDGIHCHWVHRYNLK